MGILAPFRGRYREALDLLERSRRRYSTMGMPHQSAVAELELADAYLELNLATEALAIYERVVPTFGELGMRAEQARALAQASRAALITGAARDAHDLLERARTLYAAEGNTVGEAYVTLTEAQVRHAERGESAKAEESFGRAVALIEDLRAPLPAEEFRTAFVADKLAPYDELMRLCLADPAGGRVAEALAYAERARSRALVEMMSGALAVRPRPRDDFEAELFAQLDRLREELSWLYSRINRPPDGESPRAEASLRALHDAVRERETRTLELMRQLQQRGGEAALGRAESLDLHALRRALGSDTALVEYASLDGGLLAFVVTDEGVEVVQGLAGGGGVSGALGQFRFQIGALRHGSARVRAHLPTLEARARQHLRALYDLLLRRVEPRAGSGRLIVLPPRALHYVPFHALHDGESYVVERREVSYAPSAGVLLRCLARPEPEFERALPLGVADERTPRVLDEVRALAPLFAESEALLDARATLGALREGAPRADVLHLACHGQFRPDSPLFSSLRLGDGWLTARDAYTLDVGASLVTLDRKSTRLNSSHANISYAVFCLK